MSKDDAICEIQRKAGPQFDPLVVQALAKVCKMPAFDDIVDDSAYAADPGEDFWLDQRPDRGQGLETGSSRLSTGLATAGLIDRGL